MRKLGAYLRLLRPHHFVKNGFIFAPLFFALKITDINLLVRCGLAAVIFSIIAGSVYIFNDCQDVFEDREHPRKRFRPIAAGEVGIYEAFVLFVVVMALGLLLSFLLSPQMTAIMIVYLMLNIVYSLGLKHVAIVDVFIVSLGFVIRLMVGGAVTGIVLTQWIVVMVFLLALFMSLAKRYDDFIIFSSTGKKTRKSLEGYNEIFLTSALNVTLAVILVAYILYTVSPEETAKFHEPNLYLSAIFVLFGVLRYLQITYVEKQGGSPVRILLKDRLIQLSLVAWIVTLGLLIYL